MRTNTLRLALVLLALWVSGCSMGQMVARSSVPVLRGGLEAMNREPDLALAREAIPANLKLIEGLLLQDPRNRELNTQAAIGFYGYAFGFIEDEDSKRASALHARGFGYARTALASAGFPGDIMRMTLAQIEDTTAGLGRNAVPEMFWTAVCWAKWIDMNRNDPARIAELGKAAALMQRVLELDENYYYGGPHLFFGIFFGSRPPMLGGDFALSDRHFRQAREATGGRLLMVDVLRAQFLLYQQGDRAGFHDTLVRAVNAPDDLYPEMALANRLAKAKAQRLLRQEEELF